MTVKQLNSPRVQLRCLVEFQLDGLCWRRSTRLRVIEHLCNIPYGQLKSSNDVDESVAIDILDKLFPEYLNGVYFPPDKTQKQIRLLARYYSNRLIEERGLPITLPKGWGLQS